MPPFLPEPPHTHGAAPKIGILLINLGTPAAPTAEALRPYLKQFLSDPRVVEIPRALWWIILNGYILRTRPAKSAQKYASIWSKDGSPLRVHTERQAKLLQGRFVYENEQRVLVDYAMRYGEPDVAAALGRLKAQGCTRLLVIPLYPQYAASTSASAIDALGDALRAIRNQPELRVVRSFPDHHAYIQALASSVIEHWAKNGQAEHLVMSFHGVPRFSLERGDPYHCECHKTARLLAEALKLREGDYTLTFQSRFGRAEWLKPYTQDTLEKMAKTKKTVDVICPGFVSDCLETLEEIAMECKAAFIAAGGRELRYIPCLNERADWIGALHGIARTHMADWLAQVPNAAEQKASAQRAQALGAKS